MNGFTLDKSKLHVGSMDDEDPKAALNYWLSQPPAKRLQALEALRMISYGKTYDPISGRIPRVLTVSERPKS